MTAKPKTEPTGVPEFADLQQAAEFWDTHSPLDFPEHFEEVDIADNRPARKRGITIKLEERTIDQLTSIAREQGIGPSTLARMWILDHLRSLSTDAKVQRQASADRAAS